MEIWNPGQRVRASDQDSAGGTKGGTIMERWRAASEVLRAT